MSSQTLSNIIRDIQFPDFVRLIRTFLEPIVANRDVKIKYNIGENTVSVAIPRMPIAVTVRIAYYADSKIVRIVFNSSLHKADEVIFDYILVDIIDEEKYITIGNQDYDVEIELSIYGDDYVELSYNNERRTITIFCSQPDWPYY